MADPFNPQPQRNTLDDILDQAFNDLELERQRQDNIINAPDPAQRLGEIQKIEKQTENEAPEVQEAVRQSAYTNTSYYTGKPLNKPPSIEKQENKEKSFEETIQKYQQYEQLFQPYLQEEYNKIAQDIGQPKTSEDRSVIRGPFDRKPVYSEQDLETKAISQTKKRLSDEGILEPKRTALNTLKETFTDYKKFGGKLPFIGGGVEAYETLDLLQSIKDIQRNTADQQDYAIVMNAQLEMERDSDFGSMVADIMLQLPAYAVEFSMTAGTYTAGRKAGQKALKESVNWVLSKQGKKILKEGADRFGLKAVKGVVGATTGTLARTINPKMFSRVVSNASNELLPDYELNRALDGKLEVLSSNEKSLGKSIVDGYLLTYLELLGEQSGESIPFLGKEFKTFLKSNPESAVHGLLKGLIRKNPNVPPGKFMQAVRQAGIQSVPVELMEERFTDFLQSGVEGHEFKMPTAEEWLAEAFAIGGFSVGVRGTGKALDKRSKKKLDKSKAKGLEAIKSGQLRQLSDDDITNFARSLTKEEAMELGISQETGEIEGQSDLGKEMIRRNLEMDKFPETETEFREAGARANIKQQQMESKDFVGKLIEKAQSESGITIEREYLDRTLADEIEQEGWTEKETKKVLQDHGIDEETDPNKIIITGTSFGGSIRISTAGTEKRMADEYVAVQEEMAEEYYKAEQENNQEFENEVAEDRRNYYEATGEQDTGESNIEWFSTKAVHFATQGKVHQSIGAKLTEIFNRFIDNARTILKDAFKLRKAIKEGKVSDSLLKKLEEATDFKKVGEKVKQAKKNKSKPTYRISKKEGNDLVWKNTPIEKQPNLLELTKYLTNRAKSISDELGVDLTQNTPEAIDIVSNVIAEEIQIETGNKKNALGWYSTKMQNAIELLSQIHPEIMEDPDHNQVFKVALAITSNGTPVEDNLKIAMVAYEHWRDKGVLPSTFKVGGQEGPAMAKGFRLYNESVKDLGVDFIHNFINTETTVKEIINMGYKVNGELVDAKVMGAVIFGPKVGGGFLSNLNGHYQYLTMDRWFMRTLGRIRGNLKPQQDYSKQLKRFRTSLRVNPSKMKLYNISKEDLKNDDKVIEVARKVLKEYAKPKFVKKDNRKRSFYPKTELNKASNTLVKNIDKIYEAPANGTDRKYLRQIMDQAVEKSNIEGLTMADAQAIIWFPEKRFFSKFGVGSQRGKKETDYETEARQYVKSRLGSVQPIGRSTTDRRDSDIQPSKENVAKLQKEKQSYRLAPTFYSTAERVVTEKFPPTMKSQSVENFLKKNQVKPEEIQWLDLETLLKGKQKVTKEELQEWIQANKIDVQDVMVGEEVYDDIAFRIGDLEVYRDNELIDYTREFDSSDPVGNLKMVMVEDLELKINEITANPKRELLDYLEEKYQDQLDEIDTANENKDYSEADEFRTRADYISKLEDKVRSDDFEFTIKQTSEAKYENFQLPGEKEDYRELLLTLPMYDNKFILQVKETGKHYDEVFFDTYKEAEARLKLHRENLDDPELNDIEIKTTRQLSKSDQFTTGHYDEPNILAHVRFNTRKSPAGEQVLFIEELQSDWHTKGREKGYKRSVSEEERSKVRELSAKYKKISVELIDLESFREARRINLTSEEEENPTFKRKSERLQIEKNKIRSKMKAITSTWGQVPDAPFKGNGWIELIMKRMLRFASENNFDRIAWTTSNQQINRWKNEIRQNVDQISWQKLVAGKRELTPEEILKSAFTRNPDLMEDWEKLQTQNMGKQSVIVNGLKNNNNVFNQTIPIEGETTLNGQRVSLDGLLGKQMATQIRNSEKPTGIIEGDNLTIGGQGFKTVYDFAIKKILNKMGKKYSAKVDQVILRARTIDEVSVAVDGYQPSIPVTRKMKESALKGQPTFRASKMTSTDDVLESASFKKWFKGSQVKDKDGNPLVVYHGTNENFNNNFAFDKKLIGSANDDGFYGRGFYFATHKGEARYYGNNVIPVYLSLKNPYELDKTGGTFQEMSLKTYDLMKDIGDPQLINEKLEFTIKKHKEYYDYIKENAQWSKMVDREGGGLIASVASPLNKNVELMTRSNDYFDGSPKYTITSKKEAILQLVAELIDQTPNAEYQSFTDYIRNNYGFKDNMFFSASDLITKKLQEKGYDGIIVGKNKFGKYGIEYDEVIAFEPTQIKSVYNKGTFNPHDPRISFRMAPTNLVTPLAKIYQEQKGTKKSYTKKDFEIDLVRLGYPDETLKTAMDLFGIIRIKQIATDEPTPIEKELQKIQDLAVTRSNLKERIKRAYRLGAVEKEKEIAKLQKIVTNYARNNLPVGIYSKSEVTGLLAKVRDAKRARELATALERIDRIINTVNKRSALSKWNKTVKKKANVKKVKGVTEGTVGADVQEIVYTIRGKKKGTGYMDLTLAGVEQKIELLADIMEASEDGEPTDQQSLELNLLLTYGAIKEKSAEDIARATEQFDALVTAGRVQVIEDQEAYKARMKEIGNEILDVITGGAGVQTQASAQKLGLKKEGLIQELKKQLSTFDSHNQSLEYIFDKLSRLDKTSKPLESAINNYFMPMIRQARLSEYSGLVEMNTMLKENAERIFKVKDGKLTTRLNQNTIDTIIIEHNDGMKDDVKGPLIESELTYNQAYKKWMELMDPTLHPTFEKMGWDVNKTKRQIEDQLPKDMIKWAEWQLYEFYPMYYHRVNGTFRKRFRVNMAFNPMYSPISRRIGARADEGDDTLNKSKSPMGSMTSAGSLKSRVSNQEELTWVDGDTAIMKHITEMEHFIHYTDVMREMRSVFMNRNISKSIADFHGSGISQTLNKFMDDIARGGVDRSQNLEWMDKLRANFSRSVIGINPVVMFKQLASIPAYIADIPVADFSLEFAKVFNPLEFKRMYRTLSKSNMVEMRYDQGFERDMVTALQNQKPGKLISGTDYVNTIAYAFTKMGDKSAIFLGGWTVYKYHKKKAIKQGKSIKDAEAIAMKKFEEASLRSQQASDPEDLADFQRRGSAYKLFTMFMTSPNQYYRMVIGGYRNLLAGRGSKSENLRRIFVGQFLLPTLFQFISNGFKWDDKDQAVSILLFPFSGLLFVGQAFEHMIRSAFNVAYPMGPVSILDPFSDIGKGLKKTFDGKEFNTKKVFKMLDEYISGLSKVFGVPYSGPKRAIENTIEVLTEETDLSLKDKTLKGLGFPMEKKKKKKRKKKPKIGNPVYLD